MSALGLANVKFVSASAPRNDADGFVRLRTTVFSSVASQLLKRLGFFPSEKPPKTVCH